MSVLVGRSRPDSSGPARAERSHLREVGALAAVALVCAVLTFAEVPVPALRVAAGLVLLFVLPLILIRARLLSDAIDPTARILYAFGLTILLAILVGLVANTALPAIGDPRPLRPVVLASVYGVLNLALILWRPERTVAPAGGWSDTARQLVSARVEPAQLLGVVAVVLAVLGAIRLNNDAGPFVAVMARICVVAALVCLARDRGPGVDVRAIALAATALLMGTSLRGWFITGHDIQREYIAYLLANGAQHWSMAPFESPYNACLSVTIVPTMVTQATGLAGVVVFKVVMQAAMVAVPVATYVFGKRLAGRRVAVLGAIALMTFPSFLNDLPYLVRQEVAFCFLALMLLAATEPTWGVWRRRLAISVFGVGVVLSHYSTTYMVLIGMAIGWSGLTASALLAWFRSRSARGDDGPRPSASPATRRRSTRTFLSLPVIVIVGGVGWLWSSQVTDTSGHLEETAQQTWAILMGRSPATPGSSDLNYNIFARDRTTPDQRLHRFAQQSFEDRRNFPQEDFVVQDPTRALLHPRALATNDLPLTAAGRVASDIGISPSGVNTALRMMAAALFQIFLVVGVGVVFFLRRRTPNISPEMRWICVGAVGAAAVVVVIPSLSAAYGALRAFQQALLTLAPVAVLGADLLATPLRAMAHRTVAAVWGVMLAAMSGILASAFLGGYPGQLAMVNSGLYYDLYYFQEPEVAAAEFLQQTSDSAGIQLEVVTDKVAAARLQSNLSGKARVTGDFHPLSLRYGNYVYLGTHTTKRHRATVFYDGDLLTYRYPVRLLDRNLSLVYSTASSRVYR